MPAHSLAIHLPDQDWVDRTIREYGPDHSYVIAKVHAKFPKGGGLTIPVTWVETAQQSDDPTGPGWRSLCDLGIEKETATHTVKDGAWVRLGVDVAADGCDEFVISRIVGDVIETRHCASGTINDDQVLLAEKVLEEIRAAQRSPHPVRVKAWLASRGLLQPDPSTGLGRLRLRVDRQTGSQLSTPCLGSNAAGYSVLESKKAMKQRGMKSPDRADTALLAVYEPEPINPPRRCGLLN
ncbi:hypothetical protein AB0948_30220 [Streptomyces koyangensis]|uniref:hypothetical protein n=1 Tax=Streptomyces koyangensis TaxID=188770 RepID=UPI0034513070